MGIRARQAIDALAAVNGMIVESKLLTEDAQALRGQIDRYLSGRRTKIVRVGFSAAGGS